MRASQARILASSLDGLIRSRTKGDGGEEFARKCVSQIAEALTDDDASQLDRLVSALTEIADADFRGNRSHESVIAHKALVAEGLRPA